ncbi:rhodanese-like domain-containing protein [Sinobaca sp. H24]|uniref:rhodanese-like domain-containing protein n=1 Tax=Sinobaca sp. H24 TaxID=2923376 RepID=UPI00207B0B07|nr:rhodanese-like domain-containing protein [Sinobaca sp. H24]
MTVLDVREPAEYSFSHIPGAVRFPWGSWKPERGIRCFKSNNMSCAAQAIEAVMAAYTLEEKGFTNVQNVKPGMSGWNGPTEEK